MGSLFVVAVYLLLATVHGVPEMPSIQDLMESRGDQDFRSLGELNDYLRSLLDISNLHMAKAFATETRRYKRALDLNSVTVNGTQDFSLLMENPSQFNVTSFDGATRLHAVSTEDNDYLLLSYGTDHVLLEEIQNSYGLRLVARFNTSQEIKAPNYVTTTIANGKLWIALASSTKNLVATVHIDLATGATETPQIILGKGLIGGLHMFQTLTGIYLVVGMREPRNEYGEPLTASTYQLVSKYFDNQENLGFQAKNVSSITGFTYRGNYYIVFGMMHSEGSQVYKYDVMIQSMTLIQQLPDIDVNSVLHFLELQENKHYVIVNNGISPKIYRWAGEQLLLWQDLDASGLTTPLGNSFAFSVSQLESLLLLGSGGKITFYADDVSANFMKNYELVSNCNSIGDLVLITMGDGYVLFYVCQERLGGSKVEYKKVIMEEILLEKPLDTTERLLGCLDEVQADLDARKPDVLFLEQIVQNDTLMTTDKSQNWFAEVTFSQGLTVNGSTSLHNVNITGNVQQNNYTFDNIMNLTLPLEDAITTLQDNLENLLYHTGDQQIRGWINSTVITVDKFESNSSMIKEINGMPLLDMDNTFMIDGIAQNISSPMTLYTLKTDNFTTREEISATINGVKTESLMRKQLTSPQVVTGNHKYNSIVASTISGESGSLLVNGVNTSQIVTTGSSVTLYNEKTCRNLTVQQKVEVSRINDVDLSTLQDSLVYKNLFKTQILAGNYSFETLNVTFNVDAGLINGVDMMQLDNSAVKKSQNFKILGNVNYQNMTVTTLDSPKLNNISWSSIVSDDTTTISGNYNFLSAMVTKSVVSNSVNGLDISEDVVTIDTAQTLTGKLTFTDDLVVNGSQGLLMSQGSTINNIDPLSLLSMDHLGNLIIKSNVAFNSSLQVSDHVIANMINGLDMDNIENRYWRKAAPQDVTVSPNLLSATFGGSVTSGTLNGRQMTEFLKSEGLQTITGTYNFKNETRVNGSINARIGKTINGIDLSVLSQNTVTKGELEDINAETTLAGKLSITGDLALNGLLNRWNVTSDFLRLDQTFQHTGYLNFTNKTTTNSLKITEADLVLKSLNGLDVEYFADDLVLVNENATIAGSLEVTGTAQVKELDVTGAVDGVYIKDLAERSLKKSSASQEVTGMLKVDSLVFGQNPLLETVNAKNWTAHLTSVVPLDYNGQIAGSKTFTELLTVVNDFDPGLINGVINVTALGNEILTKNSAQNISSRYTFSTNLTTVNLNAETIDGVNTSNLLLIDENGSVSGTVAFTENLLVTNLRSSNGILDGCDVVQVNSSAVWKTQTGDLEITFPITVNNLVVGQNATASVMEAGSSKKDMKSFLDNIVTKSDAQEITGLIEFITDVDINNLTAKSVDGVNLDTFYNVTVQDNSEIVINCDVEFAKALSADSLTVGSSIIGRDGGKVLINGLNVSDIHSNAVKSSGGIYIITGAKTFVNGLTTSELSVDGSLMNVPVADLVVLSNHSKVASDLVFKETITVKGAVQVDGLLDGVNLDNLLQNRIKLDSNEVLTSSTSFVNLVVEGNLVVDNINNINFNDIVLRSGRAYQTITGNKTLDGELRVVGETEVKLVNGVDIENLNRTVVRKNKAASIGKQMVFESSVTSLVPVDVTSKVNGFDLSELRYEESRLKDRIEVQNNRLQTLNATLSEVHVDNLKLSCGMYETVTYGAEVGSSSARLWGKMSSGHWDNKTLLSLIDCSTGCKCPSQSDLYEVNGNGTLTALSTENYSAILMNGGNFTGLAVFHTCNNTGETIVKARTSTEMEVDLNPESIRDAASFAVLQPNSTESTYIVTAGYPIGLTESGTILNVLLVQLDAVYLVQSIQTPYSTTTLDLQWSATGWHLLVANEKAFNDGVDPYTVPSQLYKWENNQFVLVQELIGEHVTSGMFVTSKTVDTEWFVSLTQYKAAESEIAEDNLRFNTQVLIFKYGSNWFVPYQTLNSYGVVAQTSMTIGSDLFLLLLSSSGTLDIYDHKPSEGFQFHQRIKVCEEPIDLVNTEEESRTVFISCKNPSEIVTIKFYVKGFSYLV